MSLGSSPGSRDALDVVRDVIIDRGHRRAFVPIAPRPDLSRAASLVVASRDRLGSLENAQTTVFVPKIEIMGDRMAMGVEIENSSANVCTYNPHASSKMRCD